MRPAVRPSSSPNIYRFVGQLLPLLLGWSAASIAAGVGLRRKGDDRLRGVGDQFITWGAIDGLIAVAGIAGAQKSARRVDAEDDYARQQASQASRFELVVWANAALDIGYIAGGSTLARRNPSNPYRRGTGWGIIAQGAFLFAWDVFLALAIRRYHRDRLA